MSTDITEIALNGIADYLGFEKLASELIESYQKQRLESIELKTEADGDKLGVHSNKRLPLPQTVNYEVSVLRSASAWPCLA